MAKSPTPVRCAHERWVCVDCYFAYHYGVKDVENPDPRWNSSKFLEAIGRNEWTDWSCPEHNYESSWCYECDSDEDDTQTFSKSPCQTCDSPAHGSRHRLAEWY